MSTLEFDGWPFVANAPGVERKKRLLFALMVAVVAVGYAWLHARVLEPHRPHRDFDQAWFAARAMLARRDPYQLIGTGREFDWAWPFFYPLTAAAVVLPIAWIPMLTARLLFIGAGAFAFSYAITRDGWAKTPALLSAPFLVSVTAAQWSPLLIGVASIPSLAWVLSAKPNFAIPLLGWRLNMIVPAVVGGAIVCAVSLAFEPHWPTNWFQMIRTARPGTVLALTTTGPLLLLSATRWRRPDGRLMLLLAITPQTMAAYGTLPLFLIPKTLRESMALALLSAIPHAVQVYSDDSAHYAPWFVQAAYVLVLYVPALVMVLRHRSIDHPRGTVMNVQAGFKAS